MTERGLPIADASPACPFVAFVDDRDERADRPDHRHRCYAEEPPAPRAAAHQEAYCLSSAFPVCPVFQEWARRESARARRGDADGAASTAGTSPDGRAEEWTPPSQPVEAPIETVPKRNPPRSWAAPPPWATGAGGAAAGGAAAGSSGSPDGVPEFLAGRNDASRGLAGSAADRMTSAGAAEAVDAAPVTRQPRDESPSAGPHPDVASLVAGSAAAAGAAAAGGTSTADQRLAADREAEREAEEAEYARSTGAYPSTKSGRRPAVSSTRSAQPRSVQEGPSWERARRQEAYPQIKAPMGLSTISRIPRAGILAIALVIAAVALFFIGPDLIGIGGGSAEPTATPRPSAAVTPPPSPTPVPAPTPQVYVIKEGDTLSGIAADFGLTLDELLAANETTIENPDRIAVGDEIIIPAPPPDEVDGAAASPEATPAP